MRTTLAFLFLISTFSAIASNPIQTLVSTLNKAAAAGKYGRTVVHASDSAVAKRVVPELVAKLKHYENFKPSFVVKTRLGSHIVVGNSYDRLQEKTFLRIFYLQGNLTPPKVKPRGYHDMSEYMMYIERDYLAEFFNVVRDFLERNDIPMHFYTVPNNLSDYKPKTLPSGYYESWGLDEIEMKDVDLGSFKQLIGELVRAL